MGIPSAAFRTGDLFIEYGFERVLFRYEKETDRFFRKFYGDSGEREVPHDGKLLCEAICSGVLTTAERYSTGGEPAPLTMPTADGYAVVAVGYQRTRPYWISVTHQNSYVRSGDIEVGADGRLEVVQATDSVEGLLREVVSSINSQASLTVTCADGTSLTVQRESAGYDFGLRLLLKERDLSVVSESSFYRGRSEL